METQQYQRGLANLTRQVRKPTEAEEYLTNFWVPKKGHDIFSPDYPEQLFEIKRIEKKYPEQAVIQLEEKQKVIFLQDWHWAPKSDELDQVLENFGVRIYPDCIMRNRVTLAKPTKPEHYAKVIKTIRKLAYEQGEEILTEYF